MLSISEFLGSLVDRFDGWQNAITGLGTSRDKRTGAYLQPVILDPETLARLVENSPIAERIIWKPPQMQLQNGWRIEGLDPEQRESVRKKIQDLDLVAKVIQARAWGRQYGGAALVLITKGGGNPESPLSIESVRDLVDVQVWTAPDITPDFDTMGTYPNAFRAEYFTIGMLRFHRSRLILFGGIPVEERRRGFYQGWDRSLLNTCYEAIRDAESDFASASGLLTEASVGVYKLKNLASMLVSKAEGQLHARLLALDMGKSVTKSIVLDADSESFDRTAVQWSGLADVIGVLLLRLGIAADMPLMVLLGREPDGMNATGEGTIEIWFQKLKADRTHNLTPKLELLSQLVLLSVGIKLERLELTYDPFLEETPTEKAERAKLVAETDVAYIDAEVLTPEIVAIGRFGQENGVSTELRLTAEQREAYLAMQQARFEETLEDEPDPDPPPAPPPGVMPPQLGGPLDPNAPEPPEPTDAPKVDPNPAPGQDPKDAPTQGK